MQQALAYIPEDRRAALARHADLPPRADGAVLFADISGFTALTETYVAALGPRQGVEAATRLLNLIYADLIQALHVHGGAVINFSGDGILCWFAQRATPAQQPAARAVLAAFALHQAMQAHAAIAVNADRQVSLAIKTAVASGRVHRFVVGNPAMQCIDVLAGAPVERTAAAETLARQEETLIDRPTLTQCATLVHVLGWRADAAGRAYAHVAPARVAPGGTQDTEPASGRDAGFPSWSSHRTAREPDEPIAPWSMEQIRPWLLPGLHARLEEDDTSYVGELRPATALFLRFGDLDFERDLDAPAKLNDYICWVQSVLDGHGGALIQLTMGDKGNYLYAAFGAPIAHDDNEYRAALAARALLHPPAPLHYRPHARVGLAEGRARVGPYGGPSRRAFGVQGSAVNLAAQLMMAAQPRQIVVDARLAARLSDRFVLSPLGERTRKGGHESLATFALGDLRRINPIHSSPARTALIGRHAELRALHDALGAVQTSRTGRLMRVIGDAGIGKSRLIYAFVHDAKAQGVTVAASAGQATARTAAYVGVRPLARWLLGLGLLEDAPHHVQIAHVERLLHALDDAWLLRLPLLGDLLDLPIPDNETTAAFSPQLRREALIDLTVEILQRVARQSQLLLLVEDAHWLDEASLELLQAMTRQLPAMPILLVITQRPTQGMDEGIMAALARLPHQRSLQLEPLSAAHVRALLATRLQGTVDELAVALIEQQAAGNPLFVDELTSAMQEQGHLQQDKDGIWQLTPPVLDALQRARAVTRTAHGWRLTADRTLTDAAPGLPDSIHAAVLSRFDRLPEADKLTLRLASVIGQRFAPAMLLAAHPRVVEAQILAEQCTRLRAREFLVFAGAADRQGHDDPLAFKHNITQEVVYRSLLTEERQLLHGRVGQAMEQISPDAVEQLARHFYNAPRDEPSCRARAVRYLDAASQRAQRDYANEAALHHLDRAIELDPSWQRLADRVDVLHALGRRQEEEAALDQLSALDAMPRSRLALAWADYHEAISDYAAAVAQLRAALTLATQADDRLETMRCLARLGMVAWRQGNHAQAENHYRGALALFDEQQPTWAAEADTRYGLGLVYRQQGRYDEAQAQFDHALAAYQRLGDRQNEAKVLIAIGHVARFRHRHSAAMTAFRGALALYRTTGDRAGMAASLASLAQGLREGGDVVEAMQMLQEARGHHEALGDLWWQVIDWNELGATAMMVGQLHEADDYLRRGLAISRQIGDESGVAYTLCNLGQVQRDLGHLADAEELLTQGQELAAAQKDAILQATYWAELSLVSMAQDDCDRAIDQAQASMNLFTSLALPANNVTNHACLAVAYLRQHRQAAAKREADAAMSLLAETGATGAAFPQREYLMCSQVYAALADARLAEQALAAAWQHLQRQATRITDPTLRAAFFRNLAFNRDLLHAVDNADMRSLTGMDPNTPEH